MQYAAGLGAAIAAVLWFVSIGYCPAYEWESGPGHRRAKLQPVGPGKDGFILLPGEQTGVIFTNFLSEQRTLASQILPSGSGVAAGDVDGDGRCDLYFCGLKCGNRLYRNLGNWKFEDITDKAGVSCTNLDATGAALVDLNGDGSLDLIVNSLGGGTHIFFNDGKGHFTESKQLLNSGKGGMSLAIGDYDGDGWLDVYVANYRVSSIADQAVRFSLRTIDGELKVAAANGKPLTDPEWTNRFEFHISDDHKGNLKFAKEELGEPDILYRNLGKGELKEVPWTDGTFLDEDGKPLLHPPFDWGLSAMFRDLNNDGKPDLYVCNDFNTPDRIWINQGNGRFRALPRLAIRQLPLSSMAIDVADINRDGLDDLFVVEMLSRDHRRRLVQRTNTRPEMLPLGAIENRPQYSRNMVYLNRGDGTYAEVAQYAGLEASEWSWTPIFLDVDLDGYEDLLVANGFARDNMNLDALETSDRAGRTRSDSDQSIGERRRFFPKLATPNLAFHNLGGLKFVEASREWGFDTAVISQGMCLADLDNDGDMDVIVNNFNSVAGIYRNETTKPRLAVTLKGRSPNTHGIGAKIRVYGGPVPVQSQQIISGGRYLSCDEAMRVFAAGSLTNRLRIEVDWPGGTRSVVSDASPNYIYEIDEEIGKPIAGAAPPTPLPWFEDVSQILNHSHHEDPFDDFARQPTLPKRLSQPGPGVCWCDLNGDGWDDLVIGSGKEGSLAVFLSDGKGSFHRDHNAAVDTPVGRDLTSLVALPQSNGKTSLLVGSSNYEDPSRATSSVIRYDLPTEKLEDVISGLPESIGPVAVGDIAGDGNLAVFVGGRVVPGRYPESASSRIFRYREGEFVLDQENSKSLEHIGLVSGAVWSDLDGDGFPELILACEWGPVRIFHNDHGRLAETNLPLSFPSTLHAQHSTLNDFRSLTRNAPRSTLHDLTGWWNSVAVGDFDGDGRLDIIAGNWGENSKYESHRTAPLRLYYGDFAGDGSLGTIEAYFEPLIGKYVPERRLDVVSRCMPSLRGRFSSYQSFADADIDDVLGDRLSQAHYLEASWLESTLFLNRGDKFEAVILPPEAQLAPLFGVVVTDFDGDGAEDLFLAQNFFDVEPETSRYDAGRGLWLKGNGHGAFHPVAGAESGITVYGEQRGAAAADFDRDGRTDLAVTQNAAQTRLFRNLRAKPGLRVRLKGSPGNAFGYGAQLRMKNGEQLGPVREVHGGGGYWSQDTAVQVISGASAASQIWVRWPGGKTFTVDVPSGATEIQIGMDGQVVKVR